MTRVTAPIAKLTRNLVANPSVARPSYIPSAQVAASLARSELLAEARSHDHDASRRSMTTAHRPTPMPTPSPNRTVPLMQSFTTSATAAAQVSTSVGIDATVLPSYASLYSAPADDAFSQVRVPLLPDNFNVVRSHHAPETPDAPLAREPIISIVAAHPENVVASALTEVSGIGMDHMDLKFVHERAAPAEHQQGMLRDLWKGLVEDVMGEKKATA